MVAALLRARADPTLQGMADTVMLLGWDGLHVTVTQTALEMAKLANPRNCSQIVALLSKSIKRTHTRRKRAASKPES